MVHGTEGPAVCVLGFILIVLGPFTNISNWYLISLSGIIAIILGCRVIWHDERSMD
jgi:hypothetical protein